MALSDNNKGLGPANNYSIKDNYFDALRNAFNQLKFELNSTHGMRPVEDIEGLTIRNLGRPTFQLNHVKYVVGDPTMIELKEKPHASQFLDFLEKEIKKRYKKITNDDLNVKKVSEQHDFQLYSRLTPDRSWVFGGGPGVPIMNRYILTTSRIYHVETANLR